MVGAYRGAIIPAIGPAIILLDQALTEFLKRHLQLTIDDHSFSAPSRARSKPLQLLAVCATLGLLGAMGGYQA